MKNAKNARKIRAFFGTAMTKAGSVATLDPQDNSSRVVVNSPARSISASRQEATAKSPQGRPVISHLRLERLFKRRELILCGGSVIGAYTVIELAFRLGSGGADSHPAAVAEYESQHVRLREALSLRFG